MRERYEIETVEQLRAIADLLRIRIIDMLGKRPMTVTQVGEQLGLAPAKVHYHVRELERVGLLELVETREKGGILEKYYQPIAQLISVNKTLLSTQPDEAQVMLRTLLDQMADGYLRAFRHFADLQDPTADVGMDINITHLHMTREEHSKLRNQIHEILKPFEERREIKGEEEIVLSLLAYPAVPAAEQEHAKTHPAQINWIVGAANYSRGDLLKARADGRRLRISVIGVCHFANNIEASLVDEVVESFKLVGKLTATPEVKDVLTHKEARE